MVGRGGVRPTDSPKPCCRRGDSFRSGGGEVSCGGGRRGGARWITEKKRRRGGFFSEKIGTDSFLGFRGFIFPVPVIA